MVKIRLTQTGTTNKKKYRIIAIDESKKRNGLAREILGYYDPTVKPPLLKVEKDRVAYWLSVGAQMTDGTRKILGEK